MFETPTHPQGEVSGDEALEPAIDESASTESIPNEPLAESKPEELPIGEQDVAIRLGYLSAPVFRTHEIEHLASKALRLANIDKIGHFDLESLVSLIQKSGLHLEVTESKQEDQERWNEEAARAQNGSGGTPWFEVKLNDIADLERKPYRLRMRRAWDGSLELYSIVEPTKDGADPLWTLSSEGYNARVKYLKSIQS